jgi:hypothetical protein
MLMPSSIDRARRRSTKSQGQSVKVTVPILDLFQGEETVCNEEVIHRAIALAERLLTGRWQFGCDRQFAAPVFD